jgi:ribosomal protein S18 acetylase RimI-like enzyme
MSHHGAHFRLERPKSIETDALCALYDALGWSAYTKDPEKLAAAVAGSSFVVTAVADNQLIGLARCISDDASIAYIQDILVREEYQRQGIGRALVNECLRRYAHVRQKVLLTDDRPEQLKFYDSFGFKKTRDLVNTPLNAFVMIEGADLT